MRKSLIGLILVASFVVSGFALTMKIEPKVEECFSENLSVGDDVEVRWGVQDGGLLDIEVKVKHMGQTIWQKLYFEGREEGYYKITPMSAGVYGFCFNNEMSRFTVKTVRFEFIRKNKPRQGDSDHAKPEDLNPMQQSVRRIGDLVANLEKNNNYYGHRETVHRNTAESTNSRVQWWSIVETLFVLAVAVGQVYYLRLKVNRSNMGKRRV